MQLRSEFHYGNRVLRCVADRPRTVGEMFEASCARYPDAVALVDAGTQITYRELSERVDRVRAGLASLGVGKGERVATLLNNGAAILEIHLACATLGAVHILMNVRQRAPETEYILNDSGTKILIYSSECADLLPARDQIPEVAAMVSCGGRQPSSIPYEDLGRDDPLVATVDVDEEDAACILYTSGTTGKPKGAILTHLAIVHSCVNLRELLSLQPGDCTVLAVPASHVTGLVVVSLPMLLVGGRVAMLREFKAEAFLDLAEAEGLTFTVLVPAMYSLLLMSPSFGGRNLERWRVAGFGGAPMPEATVADLNAALPSLQLASIYGSTETAGPAVIMPFEHAVSRRDAVGRTIPTCDIRIMDDAGSELPNGETGEVWISGPNVTPRYWNNAEASAQGLPAGWWRSGDLGTMDDEGFLRILDRKKDMINRGGFKIYSAEVENVISFMPGVEEAAVVGRPCPVLTERVHAFVKSNDASVTADRVRAFCAERLSDYKVPEHVVVSADPLPRNPNGKILKEALRALANVIEPVRR